MPARRSSSEKRRRACRMCDDPRRSGAPVTCVRCSLVHYCSKAHRALDADAHAPLCRTLHALREQLRRLEHELRGELRAYVGLYWGFFEARKYLQTKHKLMDAYAQIGSRDAVEKALAEGLDLLRLSRADPMHVRAVVPTLLLRLGRVQASYDFVKWWALELSDSEYSFRDLARPFLDVVGADICEPLAFLEFVSLPHTLALVVTKLSTQRSLWEGIQAERVGVSRAVPVPVVRQIQGFLGCPAIPAGTALRDTHRVAQVQVVEIVKRVHELNVFVWPAVIHPEVSTRTPDGFTEGSKDEARAVLRMWLGILQQTRGLRAAIRGYMLESRPSRVDAPE